MEAIRFYTDYSDPHYSDTTRLRLLSPNDRSGLPYLTGIVVTLTEPIIRVMVDRWQREAGCRFEVLPTGEW